jgi:hypothetical protein
MGIQERGEGRLSSYGPAAMVPSGDRVSKFHLETVVLQ